MPLSILVPLVVVGLIIVISAVHFSGGSAKQTGLNETVATEKILKETQEFDVVDVFITNDGVSALVYSEGKEQVGLVHSIGQNYLTRFINSDFIRDVRTDGEKIDLYVNDATLDRVGLLIGDEGARTFLLEDLSRRKST